MPDVPRDPRQLARDILAGKISIEELAREQQRRRAGAPPAQQPQARMPAKIPLPRPAPQPQARPKPQPPRPVIRRPVPVPPKPQQRPRPVQAPPPTARARGPQIQAPVKPAPIAAGETAVPTAEARGSSQSQTSANRAKPTRAERPLFVRNLLATRGSIRQGIVMAEILGKPLALRDD